MNLEATQDLLSFLPHDQELSRIHMVYLLLGLMTLFHGLFSLFFSSKLYINEAVFSIMIGILLGPFAIGVVNPQLYFGDLKERILLETSRLIVAICCTKIGIRLPHNYFWTRKKDMAIMIAPLMTISFVIVSTGVYLIFGLSITNSLILGACLTPTDPVLVSTVVDGPFAYKYVPERIRDLLAAESGSCDAVGFVFLFLPFYLMRIDNAGEAVGFFLLKILLYHLILAALIGFALGYGMSKVLQMSTRKGWLERESVLGLVLALTLAGMGIFTLLGMGDIVGCLFIGLGLVQDGWFTEQLRDSHIIEIVDTILNVLYFFLIGCLLPFDTFSQVGWGKLVMLGGWVIVIRRIPAVLALYKLTDSIHDIKDAMTVAWFAPCGVDTVLYALVALELKADIDNFLAIIMFCLFACTVVHGSSVPIIGYILSKTTDPLPLKLEVFPSFESTHSRRSIVIV